MSEEKSWDEEYKYDGETPDCPECGVPLYKAYTYSDMFCKSCRYGLDDDDDEDDSESLSVYDAAEIWASNGKDEDYQFGYSTNELENAFNSK